MENAEVHVIEITRERDQLITTNQPQLVDLGVNNISELLIETDSNSLLQKLRQGSTGRIFLVIWKGTSSRVPHGVQILDHKIDWTQHGVARNTDGVNIGFYDRLIDCGGEDGKEHKMLIYLNKSAVSIAK